MGHIESEAATKTNMTFICVRFVFQDVCQFQNKLFKLTYTLWVYFV